MLSEDYPPPRVDYKDPTRSAVLHGLMALSACGLPWVIIFVIGKLVFLFLTSTH